MLLLPFTSKISISIFLKFSSYILIVCLNGSLNLGFFFQCLIGHVNIIQNVFCPELQEFEKPTNTGGYRAVAFSYGSTDDSADQRNADAGLESSRFCPSFPVPDNLSQSLVSLGFSA